MTEAIKDRAYWEDYYKRFPGPFAPSPFAVHVSEKYLDDSSSLVELGCGNGRDAVHLAGTCTSVTAVDQCAAELDYLEEHFGGPTLSFVCGDITDLSDNDAIGDRRFSCVYSRFSLHAVSVAGQHLMISWAQTALALDGLLLLEFRGTENELMGVGEPIGEDGRTFHHDGHTRRFIDVELLATDVTQRGFEILVLDERPGFSPTATTDETFARLIARHTSVQGHERP